MSSKLSITLEIDSLYFISVLEYNSSQIGYFYLGGNSSLFWQMTSVVSVFRFQICRTLSCPILFKILFLIDSFTTIYYPEAAQLLMSILPLS